MRKMRIYEYARQQNMKSKEVIQTLQEMDIPVSSHMSVIKDETIQKLDAKIHGKSSDPERGKSKGDLPQGKKKAEKQQKERPASDRRTTTGKGTEKRRVRRSKTAGSSSETAGKKPQQKREAEPRRSGRDAAGRRSASSRSESDRSRRPRGQQSGSKQGERNAKSSKTQSGERNRRNQGGNRSKTRAGTHQGRRGKPSSSKNERQKHRNRRQGRGHHNNQPAKPAPQPAAPDKITYSGSLTVAELAEKLHRPSSEIIKKLMQLGVMATKNEELTADSIELIASDYGTDVEEEIPIDETDLDQYDVEDKEESLQPRPPVVTMMGHVDHGKTTLLDSIRHTKVTSSEAGGITQHIGAYQIEQDGKKITFLDTPGHAAFTTMRSRGAEVTDIAILVVAADDGVMPQTVEAINHAKAAEVPIIVAVNKTDVEGANPERVMQQLTEHGLIPEDWGGDTIFVRLSALSGEGIDELTEMILLVAELEEYKANPDRLAAGTVIEAELDKGRGPVATLLVQKGTLRVADSVVVGHTFGRVRAMVNEHGKRVREAGPSTPVEITGLNDVPRAGDQFLVFQDEKKARHIGEAREKKQIEIERNDTSKVSLDDLFSKIQEGDLKEVNVIVKADVQGSVEAVTGSLEKIEVEGARLNIIHAGAGAIKESDIILASASDAFIIGFNVRPDNNAKKAAESEKVDIRLYRVIYDAIEEVEAAMKGVLDPEFEEKVIGHIEVRETFKVSRIGTIAGSYVTDGKITRDSKVRLVRDGVVIHEGDVDSLKRFKNDAKEVAAGYECGITLENFNDIKEGDTMEAYIMAEKQRA